MSTFGLVVALIIAAVIWWAWGQHTQAIQRQLLDELALQQESHFMYLSKLKQLGDQKMDYRTRYLEQANIAPNSLSKTLVFNYLSSGLIGSSVNVSSWRWEQEQDSQHLVLDLKGTYPEIAQFLRRSLRFSEVVTIKEMSLSRDSVDITLIDGRLILAFFIAESAESQ